MSDPVSNKGFGDAALAERILEIYAEEGLPDSGRLTDLGIAPVLAVELEQVLAYDFQGVGIINDTEEAQLAKYGFSRDFLRTLRGGDGARALRNRVHWLADHAEKKWWRWDWSAEDRTAALNRLEAYRWKLTEGIIVEETLPILVRIMRDDPDVEVRSQAAETLSFLGPAAAEAVEEIIEASRNGDISLFSIGLALGRIRSRPEIAVPYMIQLAKNNDIWIPSLILAITRFGEQALPWILEGMEDPEPAVRFHMASALSNMGKEAYLALPILQGMMRRDPDETCRNAAHEAIQKIEDGVL